VLRLVHLLFQLRRALQKVSFGARNPHSTANRLRETVGDDGVVRNDVMRPCTLELGRVPSRRMRHQCDHPACPDAWTERAKRGHDTFDIVRLVHQHTVERTREEPTTALKGDGY
jgi:hypothetical protein